MTWDSFEGERHLMTAGAELFRHGFVQMLDYIHRDLSENHADKGPQSDTEVALFDALTNQQRAEIVRDLAIHFLMETPTSLKLTATHEAALYSVLLKVRDEIAMELDMSRLYDDWDFNGLAPNHWRILVAAAYEERLDDDSWENCVDADAKGDEDADPLGFLDPESCDFEIFEEAIEVLADQILSDRDFEMADIFMDAPPEDSQALRSVMGIGGDFYTDTPNDPSRQAALEICYQTTRLLSRQSNEEAEF